MSALYVVVASARIRITELRANMGAYIFTVIQPIVLMLIVLVPMPDPTPERVARVMIGVLLTVYWTATVWGAGSVLRADRAQGTLGRTLAATVDPRLVVLGKGIGASLLTFVRFTVVAAVMLLLLGRPIAITRPDLMLLGLFTVVISGAAAGLMMASAFVASRHALQISGALIMPVTLMGGILIPPEQLPQGLRWISSLISLRWLQEFLADAALGTMNLVALALALALTTVYAVLGVWLFHRMVTRARREASIDLI